MALTLLKKYYLNKNIEFFLNKKYNIFFIKTILGILFLYLPSYYFYKNNFQNYFSFIFLNKFYFKSFISHFFTKYSYINNIFIVRLKIRGLGYQIYKINYNLFSFHFNNINFFYFFIPKSINTFWYKKKLILLSNNFFILKTVFKCILLLKKLGPYRLLGIRYPKQIIILKKGGKSKK